MPKILMLGNHSDAELRDFVRVIRGELLRRQQERASRKYRERQEKETAKALMSKRGAKLSVGERG